jgi:D-Tyr-tRNAtyr deacylase
MISDKENSKNEKGVCMRIKKVMTNMLVIAAASGLLVLAGCEGSDAKKAITDIVNKIMGGEVIKKSEEMKKQLDQAIEREAKRLTKFDKLKKKESSQEGSQEGSENKSDQ